MFLTKNNSNFLKGIAMLLVIAAHYSQWYLTEENQASIIIYLLSKMGRYGVGVFFAISGYGIVFSAEKGLNKHFIKRRLVNTYFPYVLIQGTILFFGTTSINFRDIVYLLLGINAWFICVIVIFYYLFYFAWKFFDHKLLTLSIGVLIVSILLAVVWQDEVWYASNISFIIGVAIGCYRKEFYDLVCRKGKMVILGVGTGFLLSVLIYTMCVDKNDLVYLFFKIIASALWSFFFLAFYILVKMPKNRFIEQIGETSLEFYLLHMHVLQVTNRGNPNGKIIVLVVSIITTTIISIIINRILKKIKNYLLAKNDNI